MENDKICKFEPDKDWCDYTSKTIGQRKHTLQQEAFPDRGTLCKDEGVNIRGRYYSPKSMCPQCLNFKM